ncbi:MAG: hypothetical protein MJ132_03645 [Clostridia bacterium]|nr:hypothetical protein [Clostridia bacterium]
MVTILSNAKNSSILLRSTPPVGINSNCGNGAKIVAHLMMLLYEIGYKRSNTVSQQAGTLAT